MDACHVLIVEDDPLVSMHLETIVSQLMDCQVTVSRSVAEADRAMSAALDFALLDVDVLDGTTYAFASRLVAEGVPFAFVSASNRELLPLGLQTAPFIAKPYTDKDILGVLQSIGKVRSQ